MTKKEEVTETKKEEAKKEAVNLEVTVKKDESDEEVSEVEEEEDSV